MTAPARTTPARTRVGVVMLLTAMVAVLAVLVAPPARAHGAGDGIRYRLVEVSPSVDGLTVQVVRGLAGQLVLANDTDEVVEVLDEEGRPFLRIGPDGVEGDVASPTWAASDRPYGLRAGDPTEPASAEPRWVPLSEERSWGWYDHRMHAGEVAPPQDATGPVVLDTWEVPLRVGDREVVVRGETVGGPLRGFVTPRLVSDRQVADGARVSLLPGQVPGLLLTVDEGHTALVRGEAGEPFLRFADGQVHANAASPTWHRIGGVGTERTAVDATADPVWQSVGQGQRFGWIEPRATVDDLAEDLTDGAVLGSWAVPVEVDGTATSIVGELRWVQVAGAAEAAEGGLGIPWPNLLLGAAGVVTIVALVVVRRRARAPRA